MLNTFVTSELSTAVFVNVLSLGRNSPNINTIAQISPLLRLLG
jgi:hypothetical protein